MPLKLILAAATLTLWATGLRAQHFGYQWIGHPNPDGASQVWFRQTFDAKEPIDEAKIKVATTGLVDVYVNQRNVTGDVLVPRRDADDCSPIAVTFDVLRFMGDGSNTVAVWFSPVAAGSDDAQVAVEFFGRYESGQPFAFASDDSWLCRRANRRINSRGGEDIDGTDGEAALWNGDDFSAALWTGAVQTVCHGDTPEERMEAYDACHVSHIRQQRFFDLEGDSVVYDFGEAFNGFVRVTLRGAKRGQQMTVGATTYTCNGQLDEQIFPKFTTEKLRRVVISGDDNFVPTQITRAEAIETEDYQRRSKL